MASETAFSLRQLLKEVNAATRKTVVIRATDSGVSVRLSVKKRVKRPAGVTWTATGQPRYKSRPLLYNNEVLGAASFSTPAAKLKFEEAVNKLVTLGKLKKRSTGYVIEGLRLDQPK